MRFVTLAGLLVALATATAAAATAGPPWGPANPHFNLQAVLRPAAGGPDKGFGLVAFRQSINDGQKIVSLDTWVRDLAPGTEYQLQRAVDTNLDGECTGTGWLTLGQGLMPKTIATDDAGTGREALWRDLSAIPLGAEFDIQFRVVDAASKAVALESGCYTFTVTG
jgi:hypothetical protein